MPTLLVTKKMPPELAERVQASVEGRRAGPGRKLAPRVMSLIRLGLVTTILVMGSLLVVSMRRAQHETDLERAALVERAHQAAADLGPDERAAASRLVPWLALSAGRYEGDLVADELRAPGAFSAILARPMVYVRGPLSSFDTDARVVESAVGSFRDAFVLCLVDPPKDKSESALRQKARAVYSPGGPAMLPAAQVERLADLLVGLPYLDKPWQERVVHAGSHEELERLRKNFDRAPIEAAKRAARARYLLFLMDEPAGQVGPVELDGERAHDVRVGLVDLALKKVLVRLRRRVDPSALSPASRAELASGIDACALALEVHQVVTPDRAVATGP